MFFCSNPKLAILTIFISETWEDVRLGQHQQKEIRVVMNRILSETLFQMLKCCGFLDLVVNEIKFINFKFRCFIVSPFNVLQTGGYSLFYLRRLQQLQYSWLIKPNLTYMLQVKAKKSVCITSKLLLFSFLYSSLVL